MNKVPSQIAVDAAFNCYQMSQSRWPDLIQSAIDFVTEELLLKLAQQIGLGVEQKERAEKAEAACAQMREALTRIANCIGAPDRDVGGEWQNGLHCGVEDRGCQDRYQGADFGHAVGVERSLEWASSEAESSLSSTCEQNYVPIEDVKPLLEFAEQMQRIDGVPIPQADNFITKHGDKLK